MLTGKQKRFLRSKAHHLDPIFQVGKGGTNQNLYEQLKDALEARELIKVSVLQNCDEDKNTIADKLTDQTDAELVQVIGSTIVIYKESTNQSTIELP